MVKQKPKAAAIYVRISSDRTGEEAGVRRQEADCRASCDEKGWPVAAVYRDNDKSAYSGRPRPEFDRLVADLKDGTVDAVVCWHPDRLTRSTRELEDLVDLVEATNVVVATVRAGDVDLSTSNGRMTARVAGVMARHESEQKSERIRRQREQLAQEGKPNGGRRPFGYEPDGMTIRRSEARLIKEAARRVLAGESARSVAHDWNGRGISSSSGAQWRVSAMQRMLAGPRLAGLRVHRGEVVGSAAWKPILDRETHERLHALLGDPRRRTGRGRPPANLLSGGIARCGRCGASLTSGRGGGTRRYGCKAAPGLAACGGISIGADALDVLVTDAVLLRLESPVLEQAVSRRPTRPQRDALADVEDAEQRLTDLAEMFASGEVSRREWLAARTKIDERLTAARAQLGQSERVDALAGLGGRDAVRGAWPTLTLEQQQTILRALIDKIVIAPAARRGGTFDPSRVDVVWRV
jgi:DNA invertase Pin-like site-specific DNA recombinase